MKYRSKLNVLIFLLLIFGFGIMNLLFYSSRSTSSLEQRKLAAKPDFSLESLISGEWMQEIEDFVSDHLAFRDTIVKSAAFLQELQGMPGAKQASLVQQGGDNTAQKSGTTTATVGDTKYLIDHHRAYTLFTYSSAAAEAYADALNTFQSKIDSEVHIYSMLVPTVAEFMETEQYQGLSDSQKSAFEHINERLSPGIVPVDAYGAMEQHAAEDIYFRTDHHWTALGAYYAYGKLMEVMGEESVPLSDYSEGSIEGFLGSAYKATLNHRLQANPDTITYYLPFQEYTYTRHLANGKAVTGNIVDPDYATVDNGYYAVFLGGDFPWGEIKTGVRNGKTIAVVKDSYGNAFIPFLLPHFETIYYVDPRYYDGNLIDFVQEHQVDDVVFLTNATAARTTGMAKLIQGMLTDEK